jgi:penicillin-binding protein-related factor A (putative recombinase)
MSRRLPAQGRNDANQREIVIALQAAGAFVTKLNTVGAGCPDLLVIYKGGTFLLEVKDGSKKIWARQLNENQVEWHRRCINAGGSVFVVIDVRSALCAIGAETV